MGSRVDILVVGMDKITDKSSYIYDALTRRGLKCLIYSRDKTGFYDEVKNRIESEILLVPKNTFFEILLFIYLLITRRPKQVELYGTHIIAQLLYTLGCVFFRIPLSVVCIGELYHWDDHRALRKLVDRLTYTVARLLILTELYMKDTIKKHDLADLQKTVFFHNRIPVSPEYSVDRKDKIVLFLNSFKPFRRLEILVDAIPLVIEEVPNAQFLLVGSTLDLNYLKQQHDYEKTILQQIESLGVGKQVRVLPFTDKPRPYHELASVFVLPADLVFCNFSLLEAMERAVPAVVSNAEGASLIIDNETDGLIVEQEAELLADAIVKLLQNEEYRRRMGISAREKISQNFDIDKGIDILISAYLDRNIFDKCRS